MKSAWNGTSSLPRRSTPSRCAKLSGSADDGHAVADGQQHLHAAWIRSDMCVEGINRVTVVEHPPAVKRIVRDDQAALGEPGEDGFVVVDVAGLVRVHEDEVEAPGECLDRLAGRPD